MSADKHRSLARRAAWMRKACAGPEPIGFATGIRRTAAITGDILRLEHEGLLRREQGGCGRQTYVRFVATPEGLAWYAGVLAVHGADFAPVGLVFGPAHAVPNKTERRKRAGQYDPDARRAAAARRARSAAMLAELRARGLKVVG